MRFHEIAHIMLYVDYMTVYSVMRRPLVSKCIIKL